MKLPNADSVVVEREKICGYLLNAQHRYGASKARFFAEFGFALESWEVLADSLRDHAQQHEVSREKETGFGPRYEIDGVLVVPDGRRPRVRSVWQVDHDETAPRLITAHPLEE
jgi:hypothetical protein